jgi:hypothetical protein
MKLKVEVDGDHEPYMEGWSDWSHSIIASITNNRRDSAPGVPWGKLWKDSPAKVLFKGVSRTVPYWTDLLTLEQFVQLKGGSKEWLTEDSRWLPPEEIEELTDAIAEWESLQAERDNWTMKTFRWGGRHLSEMEEDEDVDCHHNLTVIIVPNISDEEKLVRIHKGIAIPEEMIDSLAKEAEAVWNGEIYWWAIEDEKGETHDCCGGYYDYDYCLSEGENALSQLKGAAKCQG